MKVNTAEESEDASHVSAFSLQQQQTRFGHSPFPLAWQEYQQGVPRQEEASYDRAVQVPELFFANFQKAWVAVLFGCSSHWICFIIVTVGLIVA